MHNSQNTEMSDELLRIFSENISLLLHIANSGVTIYQEISDCKRNKKGNLFPLQIPHKIDWKIAIYYKAVNIFASDKISCAYLQKVEIYENSDFRTQKYKKM